MYRPARPTILTNKNDPSGGEFGHRKNLRDLTGNQEEQNVQNDVEIGEDGHSTRELHPAAAFLAHA